MDNSTFYYISITVMTYIVFEGFKEFFIVLPSLQETTKKKYKHLKENKYFIYYNALIYIPIIKALLQPKVLYPIIFYVLHEHFLHEITNGVDIILFETATKNSLKFGMGIASFYGLFKYFSSKFPINKNTSYSD